MRIYRGLSRDTGRNRVQLGCLLRDLQRQAGNEAYEQEYRTQQLTAEQAELLVRLYELFETNRRDGKGHEASLSLASKSLINRQLDRLQFPGQPEPGCA